MRGSSDNGDITEKTHILVADFETTPDSEVLGSGIDFFGGTSPDYFVLESDIHVFDRFAATAVLLQPNAIALATTDTLEARTTQVSSGALHGYSGGSVQSISSSGLLNSEKPFANNTNDPIDITVQTSAEANKVLATIAVNQIVSPFTPIIAQFGDDDVTAFGTSGNGSGHSAFFDDFSFGAAENGTSLSTFNASPTSTAAPSPAPASRSSRRAPATSSRAPSQAPAYTRAAAAPTLARSYKTPPPPTRSSKWAATSA